MRQGNLWHRSTTIFVIDEKHRFCVSKRSKEKDYCPGWLDLAFGGLVNAEEMDNMDLSALREAEEEMGIDGLNKLKIPGGQRHQTLMPKFVFKDKFVDSHINGWSYVYYIPWHSSMPSNGISIKPQQSEIDLVMWLTPEQITQKIKTGSKITPDSILMFTKFMEWWTTKEDDDISKLRSTF